MDKNKTIGAAKQMNVSVLAALWLLLVIATGGIAYRVEVAAHAAGAIPTVQSATMVGSMPIARSVTIAIVTAAVR